MPEEPAPFVEPLTPASARLRVRSLSGTGDIRFTKHAIERLEERRCDQADVLNTLRAGVYDPPGCENGTWRYRVRTNVFTVVFAFRDASRISILTAWREPR